MIINPPSPFPDELFYSVLARSVWSAPFQGLIEINRLTGELYKKGISIDFPPWLPKLCAELLMEVDGPGFINSYTLVPFYARFVENARLARIYEKLMNGSSENVHINAGIISSGVSTERFLRFCPGCAIAEREKTGEAYWHRMHQIFGVAVCPTHGMFLESSSVPRREGIINRSLCSAQDVAREVTPRLVSTKNPEHETLLRIAQGADWLLQSGASLDKSISLQERYLYHADRLGYVTSCGRLRLDSLLTDFRSRYSDELLRRLDCYFPVGFDNPWPARILNFRRFGQTPIRHLLLIDFLRLTPALFFGTECVYGRLGAGPWECINPVCLDQGKPVIEAVRYENIVHLRATGGVLACPTCGQERWETYDKEQKHVIIRKRGPLWERELLKMRADPSVTLTQIAHRLKANRDTVKRHSLRLESESTQDNFGNTMKEETSVKLDVALLEKKRADWLASRAAYPKKSPSDLRVMPKSSYSYLLRHDREWLLCNCPARPPRTAKGKYVDWNALDLSLSAQVKTALAQLQDPSIAPKKVSREALIRKIGNPTSIKKNWIRLPLTKVALDGAAESSIGFALRRIAWVAAQMRKQGPVMKWALTIHSKARNPALLGNPLIAKAIDAEVKRDRYRFMTDESMAA